MLPCAVSFHPRHTRGILLAEYRGHCRLCDAEHRLANDAPLALHAIESLFADLETPSWLEVREALQSSRGKMLGALVAVAPDGRREILRAYSGELGKRRDWPQFVGTVLRASDTAALQRETQARLAELDAQIAACDVPAAQKRLDEARAATRLASAERRRQQKEWDAARRQGSAPAAYEAAKRARAGAVAADAARLEAAKQELLTVKARLHRLRVARRAASQVLSTAMFDAATLTNAKGETWPLRQVFVGTGIAGGTSDCTIPKLLEAANLRGLKPLALAEAWWGPTVNGRVHGELQAPCAKKCQPILGHLLCGLDGTFSPPVG